MQKSSGKVVKKKDIKPTASKVSAAKTAKFSSLFKNNREIPKLGDVKSKSTPSKEPLFSSNSFSELSGQVSPHLIDCLQKRFNLDKMTQIQAETIPNILAGRDCYVKSQTGSGKTLAYAIPIVQMLQSIQPRIKRTDGVRALVLVPTRELAIQTCQVFEKLCNACVWVVAGCLIGGMKKKSEKDRIRRGLNILVATPGRLCDHLDTTMALDLSKLQFLIFDEADRMLDMDFEKKINFIIFKIHSAKKKALAEPEPPRFRLDENGEPIEVEEQEAAKSATNRIDPQTILISATLTSGIKEIARRLNVVDAVHVDEPRHNNNSNQAIEVADKGKKNGDDEVDVDEIKKRVEVDSEEIVLPARLTHSYIVVPSKLRLVSLIAFILDKFIYNKTSSKTKMIIFASTNDSVQFHEIILRVFVNRKFSLYLDENNLSDVEEEDMNVDDDELVSGEGIDLDEANDDDDFELNIKKSSAAGKKPQAKGNKKQSKKSTKKSHTDLNKNNLIDVFALYGNMDQHKRAEILSKYCQSDSGLLICTDVAARGLDMPNIDWIVQFTPPTSRFDYVHRVGRSARVGHKGNGLIFLEPSEIDYLKELNKLNISIKELKLESVMECLNLEGKYYPRQMGDNLRYPRNEEECANSMQFYIEEFVETSEETHDQARKAYTSFVRSYSTYSTDLKGVFYVKNLHLGHVAKSFGLREAPSELKSSAIRSYSSHANDKDRIRRPPVNREKKEPESTESKSSASNNNRKQQQTFSKNTNFGSGFGGLLRNYKSVSEFDSGLSSTGMKPGRKQKRPSLAERMKSNKANSSNSNEKPKIKKIIKKNMDIFD